MNLDYLLFKEHAPNYTCHEYSHEVWQAITGEDLKQRKDYTPLQEPESPCLVHLRNHKSSDSHVGVYYKGGVYHLGLRGAQYIPLDVLKIGFNEVSFYK